MKQDMNGVRTAQDLEQKYNLSAIEEIKKETKINTEQITSTNNELKNFTTQITKDLGELQDQIDGNIMTWFLSGVPTLSTPPANEWTTDEDKISHLGDLYYDKETGYAYRFTLENDVYSWLKLTDSDIAEALAVANSAKDTADSKRRVFLVQPTPPYDNGDMWIKDKEIYICQISKAQGENFDARDFINDLKYTDDTYAIQVGNDLKVVSGTVLEIQNDVDEYSRTLTETQKLVNEQGEDIGILNTNYSNVNQTVEELTTKVSKIKNIEIEISGNNYVYLENTSANDLYKLSIKGDISLLFGNDGKTYGEPQFFNDDLYFSDNLKFTQGVPYAEILYPSNSLFGKNMNLVIEYADDDIEKIKLPFTYLNYISQEVCDEFYLENGNAKIIRKVGINSSMQKYELSKEVIEDLGEFNIPLKEGNPKIYLQCFDSATYSATYMPKNAYTDEFATKVELNSAINQTSEQINLSVDTKIEDLDTKLSTDITQTSTSIINEVNASISNLDDDLNAKLELKVDTENLISEINASAEQVNIKGEKISLEGTITANENFKVLEDGSIEAKNGSFKGNIYLDDGGLVFGGDGLLTNLTYFGTARSSDTVYGGDYAKLGFSKRVGNTGEYYAQDELSFSFNVSSNFVVKSAKIYLFHIPLRFTSSDGSVYNGTAKNLKLYNGSITNPILDIDVFDAKVIVNTTSYEINNAFGTNGFTGSSSGISSVVSSELKNNIRQGNNILIVKSSYTTPTSVASSYQNSGGVFGYIQLLGYTSFE